MGETGLPQDMIYENPATRRLMSKWTKKIESRKAKKAKEEEGARLEEAVRREVAAARGQDEL